MLCKHLNHQLSSLFFWSEILSRIQEKPSFKTDVCVPTRISGGDELTFSENTQPLLHILNYVVVLWSGQAFYSVCVCDLQINIFFLVPVFWLFSPFHFFFFFSEWKEKKKWRCVEFLHFQTDPSNAWSKQHYCGGGQVETPSVGTFGQAVGPGHSEGLLASFMQSLGGRVSI